MFNMMGSLTDDAKVEDGVSCKIWKTFQQPRKNKMKKTTLVHFLKKPKDCIGNSKSTCIHGTDNPEDHRTSLTLLANDVKERYEVEELYKKNCRSP